MKIAVSFGSAVCQSSRTSDSGSFSPSKRFGEITRGSRPLASAQSASVHGTMAFSESTPSAAASTVSSSSGSATKIARASLCSRR